MKKLILIFIALMSMNVSVFADGLTGTLQQSDVMTPFYGVNIFIETYAATRDGPTVKVILLD